MTARIDENVMQYCINELKSQRVDKMIINVPLESSDDEQDVQKNDNIHYLFLDVNPYNAVFNFSFNPADGTRGSV